MKHLIALGLSLLMMAPAFGQTDGPLPPGKPAGVHKAALQGTENAILIGMMVAGAGITAILVSRALKNSSTSAAAATSTSP